MTQRHHFRHKPESGVMDNGGGSQRGARMQRSAIRGPLTQAIERIEGWNGHRRSPVRQRFNFNRRHTGERRYPGKDRKGKPHIIPACSPDEMQCNPGRLRVKDTQAKTDRRRRN